MGSARLLCRALERRIAALEVFSRSRSYADLVPCDSTLDGQANALRVADCY